MNAARAVGVAVAAPFLVTAVGYGAWWLLKQAWMRLTGQRHPLRGSDE